MNTFSAVHLRDRPLVGGVVVVVDVIRAFTTAAAAFAAGAERILCVETLREAFALQRTHRDAVLMGEEQGARPAGFHLGNSPIDVSAADLGRGLVIQRTSNGTRGLAAARQAESVLAAAATNVGATAQWITLHRPGSEVTILCTGDTSEDEACAAHLGEILVGASPDPADLAAAVLAAGREHMVQWRDPAHEKHDGFAADLEACSAVDRYNFAMVGRQGGATVELRAESTEGRLRAGTDPQPPDA
jgi:2-phosphosulfolactate phosphatase